jgi:hypothetical protein
VQLMKSWKTWLLVLGLIVAFFLGAHPEIIRSWIDSFGSNEPGQRPGAEGSELNTADLAGRIREASQYALEVQSRLDAYKARFDCPEAQLLDRAFLDCDGPLALHPLRKDWYTIRADLPQFIDKHRVYRDLLHRAESEIIQSPENVRIHWTLPERANSWSRSLDDAITQSSRKLPMFTIVARQLSAQLKAQERRTRKP